MILEAAMLYVEPTLQQQFETDFAEASQYIASAKGYRSHTLKKCIEEENKYVLLIYWNTLEDHTIGFRSSDAYQKWKALLHHYYDPMPKVQHYTTVLDW